MAWFVNCPAAAACAPPQSVFASPKLARSHDSPSSAARAGWAGTRSSRLCQRCVGMNRPEAGRATARARVAGRGRRSMRAWPLAAAALVGALTRAAADCTLYQRGELSYCASLEDEFLSDRNYPAERLDSAAMLTAQMICNQDWAAGAFVVGGEVRRNNSNAGRAGVARKARRAPPRSRLSRCHARVARRCAPQHRVCMPPHVCLRPEALAARGWPGCAGAARLLFSAERCLLPASTSASAASPSRDAPAVWSRDHQQPGVRQPGLRLPGGGPRVCVRRGRRKQGL